MRMKIQTKMNMDKHPSEDSNEDVYTKEDEWSKIYTNESDGIFKEIVNAVVE